MDEVFEYNRRFVALISEIIQKNKRSRKKDLDEISFVLDRDLLGIKDDRDKKIIQQLWVKYFDTREDEVDLVA